LVSGIALLGLALGSASVVTCCLEHGFVLRHQGRHRHGRRRPAGRPTLARFLRGGEDVGGATLTRFFGFHVAVLPGLATSVLLVHLALVQKFGISVPPKWRKLIAGRRSVEVMPFFLTSSCAS